ncbi:hypothetical protein GE21DRAFT_1281087 [Neurospora crassa]|nr:hypothetical protein GE21DRAFT_1281087 [Neurospora crassa]
MVLQKGLSVFLAVGVSQLPTQTERQSHAIVSSASSAAQAGCNRKGGCKSHAVPLLQCRLCITTSSPSNRFRTEAVIADPDRQTTKERIQQPATSCDSLRAMFQSLFAKRPRSGLWLTAGADDNSAVDR